ncbi:MAG: hypothetical protein QOE90_3032 [Thermoplasmata archaeon]|jgi:hypothetical protein|nr:hypothetical protein [Thermoplasmata archaeon]
MRRAEATILRVSRKTRTSALRNRPVGGTLSDSRLYRGSVEEFFRKERSA